MAAGGGGDDGGPADGGVESPVGVAFVPEGIVDDGGAHGEDRPEAAGSLAGGELLDERVETVVEADGVDQPGVGGAGAQLGGFGGEHGERLFADDVFAGGQGGAGHGVVLTVGSADGERGGEVGVAAGDAELRGGGGAAHR